MAPSWDIAETNSAILAAELVVLTWFSSRCGDTLNPDLIFRLLRQAGCCQFPSHPDRASQCRCRGERRDEARTFDRTRERPCAVANSPEPVLRQLDKDLRLAAIGR